MKKLLNYLLSGNIHTTPFSLTTLNGSEVECSRKVSTHLQTKTQREALGFLFHGQNGRCCRLSSSSALHTKALPSSRGVSTLAHLSCCDRFLTSKFMRSLNEIEMTGVPARWLTRLPSLSNRSWLRARIQNTNE